MLAAALDRPQVRLEHLEHVIRAEFAEMPGMRLTPAQARRLWSLTDEECQALLGCLVTAGFLSRGIDQRYCRRTDAF